MELAIIIIAILFEVFLMLKNIQYGVLAVFLIYCFIPISFGINIGIRLNIMTLSVGVLLCWAFIKRKKYKSNTSIVRFLIWYCVYVFVSSLFATMMSRYSSDFIRNYLAFLVNFIFIPYILCYISYDSNQIKKINMILVYFIILIGLYGIFNYLYKVNPYLVFMSNLSNITSSSDYFLFEERGFLQGRVSSIFTHPLSLGQISVIMFGYSIFAFKETVNKVVRIVCILLLLLMCVLCGSRSAIIPSLIAVLIYFVYSDHKQVLKYFLLGSIILTLTYNIIPETYKDAFKGFIFVWDDDYAQKVDINGSSSEMRINQFKDGLKIIDSNQLFGLGQGYVSQHGDRHPEMLGYESYLFQFLIDGGLIGVAMFTFFYFYFYLSLLKLCKRNIDKAKVHALCFPYYLNILFTGIQTGTFSILMIFYFLLKADILNANSIESDKGKNISVV